MFRMLLTNREMCIRDSGMRVDYRKKGFVLFNRNLNVLGNVEHARLEELPLERFNVCLLYTSVTVTGRRWSYGDGHTYCTLDVEVRN